MQPEEHETAQGRILKCTGEIGWTFVLHEDVPLGESAVSGWARVKT